MILNLDCTFCSIGHWWGYNQYCMFCIKGNFGIFRRVGTFGSRWGTACKARCWRRWLVGRLHYWIFTRNTRECEKSIEESAGLVAVAPIGINAGIIGAKLRRDNCDCLRFIIWKAGAHSWCVIFWSILFTSQNAIPINSSHFVIIRSGANCHAVALEFKSIRRTHAWLVSKL